MLVGDPSRKYLWIMGRSPEMDEATYRALAAKAASLGFATGRLVRTKQSPR